MFQDSGNRLLHLIKNLLKFGKVQIGLTGFVFGKEHEK